MHETVLSVRSHSISPQIQLPGRPSIAHSAVQQSSDDWSIPSLKQILRDMKDEAMHLEFEGEDGIERSRQDGGIPTLVVNRLIEHSY